MFQTKAALVLIQSGNVITDNGNNLDNSSQIFCLSFMMMLNIWQKNDVINVKRFGILIPKRGLLRTYLGKQDPVSNMQKTGVQLMIDIETWAWDLTRTINHGHCCTPLQETHKKKLYSKQKQHCQFHFQLDHFMETTKTILIIFYGHQDD